MRHLVLAAILLAALLLAAGCTTTPSSNTTVTPNKTIAVPTNTTVPTSAPVAVYSANDSGKTVPLGLQKSLSILLPENPTTGYEWNASVTSGLKIVDSVFTLDARAANLTGAGGVRNWTIQGVAAGTQKFSAVYVRSFEPNTPPADQFNLTVQVS